MAPWKTRTIYLQFLWNLSISLSFLKEAIRKEDMLDLKNHVGSQTKSWLTLNYQPPVSPFSFSSFFSFLFFFKLQSCFGHWNVSRILHLQGAICAWGKTHHIIFNYEPASQETQKYILIICGLGLIPKYGHPAIRVSLSTCLLLRQCTKLWDLPSTSITTLMPVFNHLNIILFSVLMDSSPPSYLLSATEKDIPTKQKFQEMEND